MIRQTIQLSQGGVGGWGEGVDGEDCGRIEHIKFYKLLAGKSGLSSVC